MENKLWLPEKDPQVPALCTPAVEALPHLDWLSLPEHGGGDEVVVRLSAFIDDIRIDRSRLRCVPFTFTTTYDEAMFCRRHKRSINPCDRFALPNNLPPQWMFIIKPAAEDVMRRGRVKPAFMKNGGGIEVFFEKGTSDFTLIDILRW